MLGGEALEECNAFRYLRGDTGRRSPPGDIRWRKDNDKQSKGSISSFEKRVEIQGNRQNNKNPSVEHKCQVRVAVLRRSMANEHDHAEKDADICKSVLVECFGNTVDGQS